MNIVVDTNILVRSVIDDDPVQAARARQVMQLAERVVVPTVALCEFVWVASRIYRKSKNEIARSIRLLVAADVVTLDRPSVEAGLAVLDAGGDFADGVIAFEGRRLGGETFVTFDKKAASILSAAGQDCLLLNSN